MKITKLMRLMLITLSVAMVFSLFACGEETAVVTDGEITDAPTEAPTGEGTEATEPEGSDSDETVVSETEVKETESEATEVTETEVKETESKETESKETESKETESKETETTEAPECEHEVIYTTYVANPDENSNDAYIAGECSKCHDTVSKPASFFAAIETIYGDGGAESLSVFQATPDGNPAPLMGGSAFGSMITFDNSNAFYPADGLKPIRDPFTVAGFEAYSGLLGIQGWGGYIGSADTDTAVFKIVDQDGTVLVDYTACPIVSNVARPDLADLWPTLYTDGEATPYGYMHVVDPRPFLPIIGSKTVDIVFAFVTAQGVDGDVYIPFATLDDVIMPKGCDHENKTSVEAKDPTCTEAGNPAYEQCTDCGVYISDGNLTFIAPTIPATHTITPVEAVAATCSADGIVAHNHCSVCEKNFDAEGNEIADITVPVDATNHAGAATEIDDDCDVICSACKDVVGTEKSHTEGEPDADDHCILKCTRCEAVLGESQHGTPADDAWTVATDKPQYETAKCPTCEDNLYKDATKTTQGLTVFTPNKIDSCGNNNNFTHTVETDDDGMDYYHAVSKGGEGTITLNSGSTALYGVGNYVAMLTRKSTSIDSFDFWINYANGRTDHLDEDGKTTVAKSINQKFTLSEDWQLVIFDFTGNKQIDKTNGVGWTRIDLLNGDSKAGDTVDIAFIGFFDSTDDIYEYYTVYVNSCLGKDDCFHKFDGNWSGTGNVNEMKDLCTICMQEIVLACEHVSDGNWVETDNEGEISSTCKICAATVVKTCPHADSNVVATDNVFVYALECKICGYKETTSAVNPDGLVMFNAEALYNRGQTNTSSTNGKYTTTLKTDEVHADLSYIHLELTEATPKETFFYVVELGEEPIYNTGNYFAFLYRASSGIYPNCEVFTSNDSSLNTTHWSGGTYTADGNWHLIIIDQSSVTGWTTEKAVQQLRIDVFNTANIAAGQYMDIAYVGYFSSAVSAKDYYAKVAGAYGLAPEFRASFDAVNCALNGLDCSAKDSDGDKNTTVGFTYNAAGVGVPMTADLTGKTLETSQSLKLGGWCVTPGGTDRIALRVTDKDGNVSELKTFVEGNDVAIDSGICTATESQNYGDDRRLHAGFQGQKTVDLTGYEGQTVTVEIVLVTNYGAQAVIARLTNVTIAPLA